MQNDNTRDRILDQAEQVFAQQGFAGARTKTIAASAGVNPAMIHYYYGTKEGLFEAVLDRMISELSQIVERLVPAPLTYQEKLEVFLDGYFEYLVTHPNFTRLTKMLVGVSKSTKVNEWVERFFRPLFEAGIAFLDMRPQSPMAPEINSEQYLISFYCMTVSYFSDADALTVLLGRDALSQEALDARLESLKSLFFAGLGLQRPSSTHGGH